MLVNRSFGSKEQLFGGGREYEQANHPHRRPAEIGERREGMAEALIDLTAPGGAPLEGFQIMCRSAASPRAAESAVPRLKPTITRH
jgi:hypothetical protein